MVEIEMSQRRTQAERSATMRGVLADAAIEVLIERGWASVTVIEVCRRAGVTRGAFHHHYDALPALLADALRRLYATMTTEPLTLAESTPTEPSTLAESTPTERSTPAEPLTAVADVADLVDLIDATWSAIGNPRFKAVLEAWLAMANDPDLRATIGPVVAEFAALVSPERNASTVLADADSRAYFLMAREALLGLALGRATNGGRPLGHEQAVLATLRHGARLA